jgi:hypothetical protein
MTVHRINGCPSDLDKLTDDELFRLGEYVVRNLDQVSEELKRVNEEVARRELFHEPVA